MPDINKIKEIVSKMTLEQKALVLSGPVLPGCEEFSVPSLKVSDGPNGVKRGIGYSKDGCTCFPCEALLGASWDKEMCFEFGGQLGNECVNEEINVLLAPGLNMKRSPYGGRNFEYFAEDPVLTGELAAEFVNGLDSKGIGATLKHFALNNQEADRESLSIEADERTMRECYLKAFEIAIKKCKPDMIMTSYNKVNGILASENKWLLTEILRNDFGYEGVIVPDWSAARNICKSLNAGLDYAFITKGYTVAEALPKGVRDGIIKEDVVDRAVTNVLKLCFDRFEAMPKEKFGDIRKISHEKAREFAVEGITLLKNENNVLPITNKKYKRIGVFGSHAEKPVICGSGCAKIPVKDEYLDKPIDFITDYCNQEGIEIVYRPINNAEYRGAEDVAFTNNLQYNEFDLIIVFAGNNYGADTETEFWDRENIALPNYTTGLIRSVCEASDNVVLVLNTGSAITPPRYHVKCKGIMTMWYPGEGGGKAVADILFGRANPSGKLSETFPLKPRTDMDIIGDGIREWYSEGLFFGYRYYDKHTDEIWFPFGHGISYTSFEYSNLSLSKNFSDKENDEFSVSFKVKNTGSVAGKEVVQLYISQPDSHVIRPVKELKRFDKIHLEPGEEKTVSFNLTHKDLAYYNICLHDWHTESGTYEILIGASSQDIRLKETYNVEYSDDYTIETEAMSRRTFVFR